MSNDVHQRGTICIVGQVLHLANHLQYHASTFLATYFLTIVGLLPLFRELPLIANVVTMEIGLGTVGPITVNVWRC